MTPFKLIWPQFAKQRVTLLATWPNVRLPQLETAGPFSSHPKISLTVVGPGKLEFGVRVLDNGIAVIYPFDAENFHPTGTQSFKRVVSIDQYFRNPDHPKEHWPQRQREASGHQNQHAASGRSGG